MPPLVSIIVPVYQVSAYVERCLLSVTKQTYDRIECVIIDDATSDDSIEKCEKIIKEYKGPIAFKIVHHEINKGLSAARNTGTHVARGTYIYFLDSDDYITPECIKKLLSYITDDTIEMVQGNNVMVIDGNCVKGKSDTILLHSNNEVYQQFYNEHNIFIYVWNKLLRRSFIIGNQLYCKEGIICEDSLWSFYLVKYLRKACLCNEVTYYYCIRGDSISTSANRNEIGASLFVIYNDILDNLSCDFEKKELRGHLYCFCKKYVTHISDEPRLTETLTKYLRLAFQYRYWYVCLVLVLIAIACRVSNPLSMLKRLNSLRWKMKNFSGVLKKRLI